MIYVFDCTKEVCALPGKACVECGKACSQINCEPCVNLCNECGNSFSYFMDKPLSTYVVIKVLLASLELYYCYTAFSDPLIKQCTMEGAPVQGATWLQVQMGFSIVHVIFSPYFQHRVWKKIAEKMKEQPALTQGAAIPSDVVYASFKEVFLYDLGVLFYALLLTISFVWSWKGSTWVASNPKFCDPGGAAGSAAYIGMCFFWVAVVYNFCYYYCGCCASSVKLRNPAAELGYEQPPGTHQMMPMWK
eukprot:TRINITY_DN24046_c0_g1_i1.p1 TRINITY_DN24046_c0_g1~~TRINITY_DN24046_c0_g1_i1.p1  ORF type:complete len:247 (+),score=49.21 TRINITY_DN24046_c0_g1_i1:51-791(+)